MLDLDDIRFSSQYIDIHRHNPGLGAADVCVVSIDMSQLELMSGSGFFSLGLHPWFIARQNVPQSLADLAARSYEPKLLAIGECGLDKHVQIDMNVQLEVFQFQAQLAERQHKPLIIHCVRAFNQLLHCKTELKPRQAWIIHGFKGSPQLAVQLVRQGFYVSFGKALCNPSGNAARALAAVPLERVFLETDADDVLISEIYVVAAKIAGLDVAALQARILDNFMRVFFDD